MNSTWLITSELANQRAWKALFTRVVYTNGRCSHWFSRDILLTYSRIIMLETIAGVPGMIGAMTRHFHALRRLTRDNGWIHTLLGKPRNYVNPLDITGGSVIGPWLGIRYCITIVLYHQRHLRWKKNKCYQSCRSKRVRLSFIPVNHASRACKKKSKSCISVVMPNPASRPSMFWAIACHAKTLAILAIMATGKRLTKAQCVLNGG